MATSPVIQCHCTVIVTRNDTIFLQVWITNPSNQLILCLMGLSSYFSIDIMATQGMLSLYLYVAFRRPPGVRSKAGMRNQGIAYTPKKNQNIHWLLGLVGTSARAQVKLQHIKLIIDMYLLLIDGMGEISIDVDGRTNHRRLNLPSQIVNTFPHSTEI